MTLTELMTTIECFREREEARQRELWEMVQVVAYYAVVPFAKADIKPADVLPLPWQQQRKQADPKRQRRAGIELARKLGLKLPDHLQQEINDDHADPR